MRTAIPCACTVLNLIIISKEEEAGYGIDQVSSAPYLGGCASTLDPIFQIGKASLTPEIIQALDEALEKRELIKISVLKNCADDPREIAQVIAERTHSAVVKVIGKKIILFRQAKKNSKFELPA